MEEESIILEDDGAGGAGDSEPANNEMLERL
jgi:hypothetical protein